MPDDERDAVVEGRADRAGDGAGVGSEAGDLDRTRAR